LDEDGGCGDDAGRLVARRVVVPVVGAEDLRVDAGVCVCVDEEEDDEEAED
jgi:hypothetical protein